MMQSAVVQKFRTRNHCILHFNFNFSAAINYSFLIAHTLRLLERITYLLDIMMLNYMEDQVAKRSVRSQYATMERASDKSP